MEPVSVENLIIGREYLIEVQKLEEDRQLLINAGQKPAWNSFTFGEYLGKEIQYLPEIPKDDKNYFKYFFVINNFYGSHNEKRIEIKNEMQMLQFRRPKKFDPRGRNIVMDNVIDWINDGTWRPSGKRELEMPVDAAKEYLRFYEKKNPWIVI